jgi:hypothetical protein
LRAILLIIALTLATTLGACDPFAPHESNSQTVEGCSDAVKHLRTCCPAWDSYISCTYFMDGRPSPDLSEEQSRCLAKKSCADIAKAVERGSRICGFAPVTKQCTSRPPS